MKKLNLNTVNHFASIINNVEPNGRLIVEKFKSFNTFIDNEDVSEGGYCQITRSQFCEKYCAKLNSEERLTEFILFYLSPSNFTLILSELENKVSILNEFLNYDDLKIVFYNNKRKVKYLDINQADESGNNTYLTNSNKIKKTIINSIEQAEKSIWISMYQLTSTDVFSLLLSKSKRNLDIQIILDDNLSNRNFIKDCVNLDFPILFTKGYESGEGIHHDKYFIIDGNLLLNGSVNATFSGLNKNSEHLSIDDSLISIKSFQLDFIATRRAIFRNFYLQKS